MKSKMNWHVRLGAVLSLTATLASCGGGGESTPPAPRPDGGGAITTDSWYTQRLGVNTNNLYPGNTYDALGGEPPYALWLVRAADGTATLNQTVASGSSRGFATSTRITDVAPSANSNTTIAVVAGNWSMVTWTESDATNVPGQYNLFIRLKSDQFDSGAVKVSSNFSGSAWSVRMVIDDTGRARAYWDEQNRSGVNGQFVNGVWTPEVSIGDSATYLQRYLVGPDGQGLLFYARQINSTTQHFFRRISAADGLGSETRLDDPAQGTPVSQRLASAEGLHGFTTVSYQQVAYASTGCFAIRRMVADALLPTECITVSGATMPNQNYVSLASDVSGHAVLVWSTGTNDRSLYASRRSASGIWSAPVKLADVTGTPADFSWLSGVKTSISSSGQALVIMRASSAQYFSPSTVRAFLASPGGNWSAATELAGNASINRDAALAFNAQGVPGVLQLVAQTDGTDAVMMSKWVNGAWKSEFVRSGMHIAFINSIPLSTLRLTPQGSSGWLALWDEGNGPNDPTGYRELWAAEYR